MNRAELIEAIVNQTGLTKNVSREAVDTVISAIIPIPFYTNKSILR